MKIRNGFVSNSSSSSFIIGVKGKDTLQHILSKYMIKTDNVFAGMFNDMLRVFINAELINVPELYEWYDADSLDELPIPVRRIVTQASRIYKGEVSDDERDLNAAICSMGLECEDSNLIIYKEEAY